MTATNDLKQTRESYGLNQSQFARLLRVHRQTWVKWERGEQEPPAIALTALAMLDHMRRSGALMDWLAECE